MGFQIGLENWKFSSLEIKFPSLDIGMDFRWVYNEDSSESLSTIKASI